jgi:ribosomal protein S27AE
MSLNICPHCGSNEDLTDGGHAVGARAEGDKLPEVTEHRRYCGVCGEVSTS